MRKQIRGLSQASANAEDGISTVQTAEGALSEVQDMLQRMNELAVKSANGTNSDSDRSYIQNEIDQLTTEIDRVAQTTKFNETYLLKGNDSLAKGYSLSYKAGTADVGAAATMLSDEGTGLKIGTVTFTGSVSNATTNDLVKSLRDQGITVTSSAKTLSVQLNGDAASNYKVVTGTVTAGTSTAFDIYDLVGNKVASFTASNGSLDTCSATLMADKTTIQAQRRKAELAQFYDKDGNAISANALGNYFTATAAGVTKNAEAGSIYDAVGKVISDTDAKALVSSTKDVTAALNIKFQVGADTSSSNKISVNIDSMSAKGLGINGLKVSTTNTADAAVNTISEAIQKVSKQRSALGAVQNRLEHTINNLDNVVENTTSAESAIRDTDMATEMVAYSNANILSQAGQAMLAQSNQSNQGVLSLLG
jgi:flagellin